MLNIKLENSVNWSYIIIAVGVIFMLIVSYLSVNYNVDSIYDEGYLFLCQQSAFDGNISGMSQGTNIIASIFGETICDTIYGLRVSGWWLKILCGLLFGLLTYGLFGTGWKHYVGYIVICILMIAPSLFDIILCHNGLAQFFLCISTALGCRLLLTDSKWNYVWCILIGILCIFGAFSILPSTLLLMASVFVLFFVRFWNSWKMIMQYIACVVLGLTIGLLLFHIFVIDMPTVFSAMMETATSVTNLDRGYDPMTFLVKLLLFMRDWGLCGIVIVGSIYVSNRILDSKHRWLANLLLLALLIVYSIYQQTPRVTMPMLFSSMWLLLLFNKTKVSEIKCSIDFNTLLNLFLLFAPIILSIGTNTYLGGKMKYFMLPWTILLYRLGWNQKNVPFRIAISIFVSILMIQPAIGVIKTISNKNYLVETGPLKNMYLNVQQKSHFELCDSIMSKYNFQAQKSVVYSTQMGMMTTCYLDGVNCANYFQPMDFVAYAKNDNLERPDFMFLCDFDEQMSYQTFKDLGWGWPEEFDEYDVGTPETAEVGYPTTRKLYCRKKNKKDE